MSTVNHKTTWVALLLLGNLALVSNAQGVDEPDEDQDDMVVPIVSEENVSPNPAISGTWSEVFPSPVVPVAGAMMPDGRALLWSAYSIDNYELPDDTPDGTPHPGQTATAIFDPVTGESTDRIVTETNHDMFCPGISYFPDGRIIVTGGKSAEKTSVFDPVSEAWTAAPDMVIARGYQSSVLLSTREVFVLGGSWSGEDNDAFIMANGKDKKFGPRGGELTITDPATGEFTWKELTAVPSDFIITKDREGPYRADNHAWLFPWTDGKVFHAGPSQAMHWITTEGEGEVIPAGTRPGSTDGMCGSFAMYDAVKGLIMTAGGSESYTETPGLTDAALITLPMNGTGEVTAEALPPMKQGRAFASTVILPDGKVVITGGMELPLLFKDDGAFMEPELWDPETKEFTLMAPMTVPRTYHSIALLLKDGRVMTGGGGLCGPCKGDYFINHLDTEIWSPPYLFNQEGQLAERPKAVTNKAKAANGEFFRLWTNQDSKMISMVRLGSATHAVNTDQRRIEICGPNSKPCEKLPKGSCPNIGKNKPAQAVPKGDVQPDPSAPDPWVPSPTAGGAAGDDDDDAAAGGGDDDDAAAGGDDDDDGGAGGDGDGADGGDGGDDYRRSRRSSRKLLQTVSAVQDGDLPGGTLPGDGNPGGSGGGKGGCYQLIVHEDAGIATPGYWWVYTFNQDGVPSEGVTLHVT